MSGRRISISGGDRFSLLLVFDLWLSHRRTAVFVGHQVVFVDFFLDEFSNYFLISIQ